MLTPFSHSPIDPKLEEQGRILHSDWSGIPGEVVFKPAKMTPDELQKMYEYA